MFGQQYLVSGCGYDKVTVIDRNGKLYWSFDVPGADCNDAEETSEGDILMAYKHGAMLVSRDKTVKWDYKVDFPNEEMYTATQLSDGNFLLACCGTPSRIIELNAKGKVISELLYDTGITNVHSQFRQIEKTVRGTYIIPLMGQGSVREISSDGKVVKEFHTGGTPFQVSVLDNGNWLVACGDGHNVVELDSENGQIVKCIDNENQSECRLNFVAECTRLDNGNTLMANWGGHDNSNIVTPIIIEFDNDNNISWSLYSSTDVFRISSVSLIDKEFK